MNCIGNREPAIVTNCVILGDRQQNVLEGIRGLLNTIFDSVVMVANKASLVEAIQKMRPKLAVVDLSLLSEGNVDNIHQLSQRFGDVKIIVLSNYDEPTLVTEVMAAGVVGYVLKQHAGVDLLNAVDDILEGRPFISPAIKVKSVFPKEERT